MTRSPAQTVHFLRLVSRRLARVQVLNQSKWVIERLRIDKERPQCAEPEEYALQSAPCEDMHARWSLCNHHGLLVMMCLVSGVQAEKCIPWTKGLESGEHTHTNDLDGSTNECADIMSAHRGEPGLPQVPRHQKP